MATEVLEQTYTINESEALKIIGAPKTKIKESGIFNDLNLSNEERISHARNILNSRKCK